MNFEKYDNKQLRNIIKGATEELKKRESGATHVFTATFEPCLKSQEQLRKIFTETEIAYCKVDPNTGEIESNNGKLFLLKDHPINFEVNK